ncbi:MAG: hypothetical protein ABJL99_25325 [Aliishimia sp.]
MAKKDRIERKATLAPCRVLRIYGMRRSGNHAIINWLQRNAPGGNSIFLNNCRAGRDPIKSHRSLEVFRAGSRSQLTDDSSLQDRFNLAGQAPLAMVSYEDAMPSNSDTPITPLFPNAPAGETIVIIYRSFLNWSASLLQKVMGNSGFGSLARARIVTVACTGYATALERVSECRDRGFVAICYDKWHSSTKYREGILTALGFEARDNSRGAVQRYGGGSSFQGKAAKVDDLETHRRSEQMAENPEYQTLLWTVSHDLDFMQRLSAHFPDDARRLLALAETAQLWVTLPKSVPTT